MMENDQSGYILLILMIVMIMFGGWKLSYDINEGIAKEQAIAESDIKNGKIINVYYTDDFMFGRRHYVITESGTYNIEGNEYYKILETLNKCE